MTDQSMTDLAREFMAKLRDHLSQSADGEPEQFVERLIAGGAALAAVAMMALPSRRKETIIAALLQAAVRHAISRRKVAEL